MINLPGKSLFNVICNFFHKSKWACLSIQVNVQDNLSKLFYFWAIIDFVARNKNNTSLFWVRVTCLKNMQWSQLKTTFYFLFSYYYYLNNVFQPGTTFSQVHHTWKKYIATLQQLDETLWDICTNLIEVKCQPCNTFYWITCMDTNRKSHDFISVCHFISSFHFPTVNPKFYLNLTWMGECLVYHWPTMLQITYTFLIFFHWVRKGNIFFSVVLKQIANSFLYKRM